MQGRGSKQQVERPQQRLCRGRPSCRGVDRNMDGDYYDVETGRPSCRGVDRNQNVQPQAAFGPSSPLMQGRGSKLCRRRVGRLMPESSRGGGVESGSRSEEHTSELQSLMRTSYAVFCLTKKSNQS